MGSPTCPQVRESSLSAVVAELRELAGRIGDAQLRAEIIAGCDRLGGGPPELADAHPTPRELDVLALAAAGYRNADIAGLLGTSTNAVKSQLRRAMRRLGVRTRHAAVSAARARGLLR
ncbi:response regulator transcription factor [Pseudonocardia halophobica]|uniref:response regulator transcription factor n=1 Tax=Pseudonocardia halophobica TaxID=29401 RepID=UPI003D89F031